MLAGPAVCPAVRPFVSAHMGAHLSIACDPGVHRTLALIQQRFWWPSMACRHDVWTFVAVCTLCNKSSHRPSAGLLQPRPIPPRPWSHIALDFVTGLHPSEGNDNILTVVDRFNQETSLYNTYYGSTKSRRTSCQTADPSSPHRCERHSARPWEPPPASPQGTIPSPMGRQSGQTRV